MPFGKTSYDLAKVIPFGKTLNNLAIHGGNVVSEINTGKLAKVNEALRAAVTLVSCICFKRFVI